jgi:3,4-dihydroxy 2-butanone 4-phosphate synthase/GTP cyclohydrolase II
MMIRYCSGIVCVPMLEPQLKRLGLGPMVQQNREVHRTDFTASVDAVEGITTGISAYDRTETIRILANPAARPEQLVQPGHVFPLRARPGGVLERAGHTEAAVDLAILAGLHPSGVLCELVNDDGSVQRLPQLLEFKRKFGLKMISISALIEYRHHREQLVEQIAARPFASEYGEFQLHIFRSKVDGRHHLAFTKGHLDASPTLVRVHTENLLSDVFHASDMGSHRSLLASLERVAQAGHGVIVYMEQTGRMQEALLNTAQPAAGAAPASLRDYGTGAQILTALGLKKIRLLQHSPRRVVGLDGYGLEIIEQIPV